MTGRLAGALLLFVSIVPCAFAAPCALAVPCTFAAEDDSTVAYSTSELRTALLYGGAHAAGRSQAAERRSVPLALGMSAVLPGLGQAYNDDWIKGAAVLALEVGLIAGYFIWKNQGLDEEDAYIDYAHEYWSAERYASWLNDYVEFLETEHGAAIGAEPIDVPSDIDLSSPDSWSTQERSAVRSFFDRIRAVEGEVFHPETGATFSHKLPYFGEQQYYELIGKYFQFAPGWVDYPNWREDGEFTQAIDPELSGPGGTKLNIQGQFLEYADEHAHANTLLRRASRVSAAILLNHIVAAFDAAISAKLHNDRLDTDLSLRHDIQGRAVLYATARWRF